MSNRLHSLVLTAFVLSATPAAACINTYGTDLQGRSIQVEGEGRSGKDLVDMLKTDRGIEWRQVRAKAVMKGAAATIEDRTNLAAALLHLGEVRDAVDILKKIEREKPGLYATATNLGTAYELAGDNGRALHWIREGIRRNPRSHDGSEWLHVRILETKLSLEIDPKWLETHSILSMGFGSGRVPNKPSQFPRGNDGRPLDAGAVKSAIINQMQERLQFVRPPEPVVGDILFDYANLLMRTEILESADAFYELAIEYGAPRTPLAKQRRAYIRSKLKK